MCTPCRCILRSIIPPWTPQGTSAFNQPLSFDTSSVTDMYGMFRVRLTCHAPDISGFSFPAYCPPSTCAAITPRPPSVPFALVSTRQEASAFNQPLSLDTSSVTDMSYMFEVCSTRAMHPIPSSSPAPLASPSPLYRLLARTVPRKQCAGEGSNCRLRLPPLSSPCPHIVPTRMPSFRLCSSRRRSTSR